MKHALLGCRTLPDSLAVLYPPAHMMHKPAVRAGCPHRDAMHCTFLQLHGAFLLISVQTMDAFQVSRPAQGPVLRPNDNERPRTCHAASTCLVPKSLFSTPDSPLSQHHLNLPGQSAPAHVSTLIQLCQCMPLRPHSANRQQCSPWRSAPAQMCAPRPTAPACVPAPRPAP